MPNTKSAERRMRSSARKQARNLSATSRTKTLEGKFATLVKAGKKDEAAAALKLAISALDKAAKGGVIHKGTASRKKSRLTTQLNRVK